MTLLIFSVLCDGFLGNLKAVLVKCFFCNIFVKQHNLPIFDLEFLSEFKC